MQTVSTRASHDITMLFQAYLVRNRQILQACFSTLWQLLRPVCQCSPYTDNTLSSATPDTNNSSCASPSTVMLETRLIMFWHLMCEYLTDSYHSSARSTPIFLKDAPHQVPALSTRVACGTATVFSCVPHQIFISVRVTPHLVHTRHVFYVWRVSLFVITSRNVTYATLYVAP